MLIFGLSDGIIVIIIIIIIITFYVP